MKTCSKIVVILFLCAVGFSLLAQTIIENSGPEDLAYLRITDAHGDLTSELRMGKGQEAFINERGKLIYGTGQHQLVNRNGKGQYISIFPSSTESSLLFGFRVDHLTFRFVKDTFGYYKLMVDNIKNHGDQISASLNEKNLDTTFQSVALRDGRVLSST